VTTARASHATAVHAGVSCEAARTEEDLRRHPDIRRAVFVDEQRVFARNDHDEYDDDARTVHVLGRYDGQPAGAVRLFPLDAAADVWQGDRLCVLQAFRTSGVGGPLVRYAVASAGAAGGTAMVAHIQLPNVRFFEHLGWSIDGAVEIYVGLPHQRMRITLPTVADGLRQVRELEAG
jgi:putative N-acetyltransferase (TIGR04045 family)